ncbi:MAG: DnaJ domain-containing protein [Actinomycetota bacterium]|nr:DnaJ domain-containing protein [Actinomycetota bacterium]
MATYYELLGVKRDATAEEIQRAYRLLARRYHPDVAPDADRDTMAAINAAWAVLGDPIRRGTYDAALGGPEPPARPAPPPESDWQPLPYDDDDLDPEDLSDEPYASARPRPSDHLVMTPVLLVVVAAAMFFLSIMSGSTGLRTFSILLVPVSGLGFVMAPLFVMLRSKSRARGGEPPEYSRGGEPPEYSAE